MKIDKQMLIWNFILIYCPFALYVIVQIFLDSSVLFIPFMIYLIVLSIFSKLLSKSSSKMKFVYENVISSKNDLFKRNPIILWGSFFFFALLLFIFIILGLLDDEPGKTIFFLLFFGYIVFIPCVTFNFEKQ